MRLLTVAAWLALLSPLVVCSNNPYRDSETGLNVLYNSFNEPPKHFDPAISYASDEYDFIGQILEPPLQYHYLKFPSELVPLLAETMPLPRYYDAKGAQIPADAPTESVARAEYDIRIRKGAKYQNHPCFAKKSDGTFLYRGLAESDVSEINEIIDFPKTGTRELEAADFVLQLKRLCDPQLNCPIFSIISKYIDGMDECSAAMDAELARLRAEGGGPRPGSNLIKLDYSMFPLKGVELLDKYSYRITLKAKYPQMMYWLAMPFFCPMPQEAVDFYYQEPLARKNITIDKFPIGTGPYRMDSCKPNMEIVLVRNENFRGEPYPSEGEPADGSAGLLADAGKMMPFVDKAVYKLEKEAIPRWTKFLQGYYDASGIPSDSFDQAVIVNSQGGMDLTGFMKEKQILHILSPRPTIYYFGFNMDDATVGGYTKEAAALRQAIGIALNTEEYIQIFLNDIGMPAMGLLAPGIFGYEESDYNPTSHTFDSKTGKPVRKSLDEARALLANAGYPGGRDKDGNQLVVAFDSSWKESDKKPMLGWIQKRLRDINIEVELRTTDYNRFKEKMRTGAFQIFFWGWNADYPDPENFLFLLYGPNSQTKYDGENHANYESPEFDALFSKLERMDNGPERLRLIKEAVAVVRRDAPWVPFYHPMEFSLIHDWYKNYKPNKLALSTLKYIKIDTAARAEYVRKWNQPEYTPVLIVVCLVLLSALPVFVLRGRCGKGAR